MRKLLSLHCWFGTPDSDWRPYLKKEAEKIGYQVTTPFLVDNKKPTLDDWTKCALKDFELDENTTIVGHSLGSVLAMKLVQNSSVKIDKLILVGAWDYWDLTPEHESFFTERVNHKAIKDKTNKIYVIHGSNDPYTTIFTAEEMAKRFEAEFIRIENGGHITENDGFKEFPQLIPLIS